MEILKIDGREIPLRLTTKAFRQIKEQLGPVEAMNEWLLQENDYAERLGKISRLMAILGNEGLRTQGSQDRLTAEEIEEDFEPKWLMDPGEEGPQMAMIRVIGEAMRMETQEAENRKHDRDLVLEEIERKKEPTASAGDS